MPEQFPHPEIKVETPAEQPRLSRRERRGKSGKQQQAATGKIHDAGRIAVPAAKHQNYRRG
ncbi:hypothetical protein LTV02_35860 [Nocardia yamanashiensis]|uniref:hypothetical protein n=1 Tax=Nocardia yamanashiensis TaxID=209247 RepID=UPI0008336EA6|nr:hypothetical protein [Nocardia yamanashiensis]UGT41258.1 hypothetical protein LTV02_35860 [Nocardia yamanashiensis]